MRLQKVNVRTASIERHVRESKLVPDLVVPMSEHRAFKCYKFMYTLAGKAETIRR